MSSLPAVLFAVPSDGGGHEPNDSTMKKLHCLAATLALTATSFLAAQTSDEAAPRGPHRGPPGGRGPGGHGGPRGNPIVRVLDADKNGELSAEEIAAAPTSLATLDTNADGTVSAEELHPGRPANAPTPPADAPARPHPVFPVMLALDANKDGALSAAEIKNAAASLKALDANGDGKLTRDELRPLPPTE